ncbi:MAG: TrkA C-terminal domain-containing protein [Lachnospiraceae bacterium]
MEIINALLLLAVAIILYNILLKVFTVLFQLTGLTKEKARMQTISLLTNSGFTTTESEVIMIGPQRRRLAKIAMLTGYTFAVLIISVLSNIFFTLNQAELQNTLLGVVYTCIFLLIFYVLSKLIFIQNFFNKLIEEVGTRIIFGKDSNILIVIDLIKENAMVEVIIKHLPKELEGKNLFEANLKVNHQIQVLWITRNQQTLELIDGNTIIQTGDQVLLFGDYKEIKQLFINS